MFNDSIVESIEDMRESGLTDAEIRGELATIFQVSVTDVNYTEDDNGNIQITIQK